MSICVSLPLSPFYNGALCNLKSVKVEVEIPLSDGAHTITTPLIDIGTLKNKKNSIIQAQITLWYKFDSHVKIIDLCSNDLISKDSMQLKLILKGTSELYLQRTYPDEQTSVENNGDLNSVINTEPNLQNLLKQTIREANTMLIEIAKTLDLMVIELTPLPRLTPEEMEAFSFVYYKGKFKEFYNPHKVYNTDHIVVGIDSIWKGVITFNKNMAFANVIGSSGDSYAKYPAIGGQVLNWIRLWMATFKEKQMRDCTSLKMPNNFECTPNKNSDTHGLKGGHIIQGSMAKEVNSELDMDNVYIIPICSNHNLYSYKGEMYPYTEQRAVVLSNYMKPLPKKG